MAGRDILKGAFGGDLEEASRHSKLVATPGRGIGDDWAKTGIGAGAQGGEIVARRGLGGIAEFSNADSDRLGATRQLQSPGITPSTSRLVEGGGQFAQMGSASSLGNGIGTFSQAEAGDSKLAMDRFERASAERAKMVDISRRGEIGEGGGRVAVIKDSSRAPSLADVQRSRLESRQAQTDALQQQSQLSIAAGLQQATTEQLRQNQLGLQIRGQEQDFQREQSLTGILAGMDDPNLQADDRERLERDYLMRSDPKAYLDSKARSGIGQVNLENKQLQQQVLRQTLQQGQLKSEQDLVDRRKAAEGSASAFEQAIYSSDQLLSHKGLGRAVGTMSLIPSMPGSEAADFEARLDTLKAQTFLPQVQSLKGMGALSDAEGKKLLDAVGALSTSMKPETFRAELKRVRDTLAQSQERAMRGVPAAQSAQQEAQPSKLVDGLEVVGGRAASPARVSSDSDYAALPSGATFVAPDGSTRRKP